MDNWTQQTHEFVGLAVRGVARIAGRAAVLGGRRSTVAWLLDEFFVALAEEIEGADVSQAVAAGMFGLSRRTYLRQLASARSRLGQLGNSLWWDVWRAIGEEPLSREAVFEKFSSRSPEVLASILRDLVSGAWVERDADGLHRVTTAPAGWDEELLVQYLASRRHVRPSMSAPDLAKLTGLSRSVVAAAVAREEQALRIARPFDESPGALARMSGLALATRSFVSAVHARLDEGDTPHRIILHSVSLESDGPTLKRLRAAFDGAVRGYREEHQRILDDAVDGEFGSHRHTTVLIESVGSVED